MWPPHFLMNFGNSSYSVTYRNICKDFVTNLSSNRDAKHYEFRTIKILTYQYLVPIVSLLLGLVLNSFIITIVFKHNNVEFENKFYLFILLHMCKKPVIPLFPTQNFRITFLRLDIVWLIRHHNRMKMFLKEYSSDVYKCMVSTFKRIFFNLYITSSFHRNLLKVY